MALSQDFPRLLWSSGHKRKARKVYECAICRGLIPAGSFYWYAAEMTEYDTQPHTTRTHLGDCGGDRGED